MTQTFRRLTLALAILALIPLAGPAALEQAPAGAG
jgi:hypothetical protein